MRSSAALVVLMLVLSLLQVGCSGAHADSSPPVKTVTVSPATASLKPGESQAFDA